MGVVMPLCSLIPRHLKKKFGEQYLVSTVRTCAALHVFLETTVILVSVSCTLLNHGSHYIYHQASSFNKAVSCALSKVGKRNN